MAIRSKYRFLFVSAPFGGIEVFFRNLQRVIGRRQDVEATWIWLDFEPKEWIARIPPVSLNWTLKGGFVSRLRVQAAEAANGRFDAAIFNHTICAMFVGNFGRRVPLVLSVDVTPRVMRSYRAWYQDRQTDDYAIISKVKEAVTRRVYNRARFILPWSRLVKESLVTDYGIAASRLDVVPPGVDVDAMTKNGSPGMGSRAKNSRVNVLFVGADFRRKGGDLLLDVATRDEFRHCCFHVVTRDRNIRVPENVSLHTDVNANTPELFRLFKQADVFTLPSRADLSPNVISEAMAFGLPVVATDVGAVSEVVQHGKTGYLVAVDDKEALAGRLSELASNHRKRDHMGEEARKYAVENLNMRTNAEKILDYLKEVADRSDGDQPLVSALSVQKQGEKP